MKRKLRKSLSWLLTVAMVASLFCGAIPTASAVENVENLSIAKQVKRENRVGWRDTTDADVGTTVQYQIVIENSGDSPVEDIEISDYFWGERVTSVQYSVEKFQDNGPLDFGYEVIESDNADVSDGSLTVTIPAKGHYGIDYNGKCTITYSYVVKESDANLYRENDLTNTASITGGRTDSATVSVQPLDELNNSELHTMYLEAIRNKVRDAYDLADSAEITIRRIYVHGTDTVEGGEGWTQHTTHGNDVAWHLSAPGINAPGDNWWNTLNSNKIVYPDTIDVIEICADTPEGVSSEGEYVRVQVNADHLRNTIIRDGENHITELYLKFDLKFDANGVEGLTVPETQIVEYNTTAAEPTTNVDVKWYTDAACTDEWDFSTDKIFRNTTLYAKAVESTTDHITGFEKTVVRTEPTGITLPSDIVVKYPAENETVEVPVNSSVTLMYQFTVEGKAGTQFTITDNDATVVGSNYTSATTGSITGTIPEGGTATIYAIKTFQPEDIDEAKSVLTNNATITVASGTIADGENSDNEEVPAQEGAPLPPTEKELDDLFGDGTDGAVTIRCTTAETSFSHEAKTYGLLEGGYRSDNTVTGTGEDGDPWTCTITVTPSVYVTQYTSDQQDGREHSLAPTSQQDQTITLIWDRESAAWVVSSPVPVEYTVTCTDGLFNFNATEFHIMGLDDIKEVVEEETDIAKENIGIYAVYVNGANYSNSDEQISATGGFGGRYIYEEWIWFSWRDRAPDEGVFANGFDTYEGTDFWRVMNTFGVVNDDAVTGITIYYKDETTDETRTLSVPSSDFAKIEHLDNWQNGHITEIYLKTPDEPEPKPEYTLTYNYNDATEDAGATTETDSVQYASSDEVQLKEVSHTADNDGVVFVGWTEDPNPYTKSAPATDSPGGLVTEVTFQDENITVYAAWAQDANNNGTPDYEEGFVKQNVYVYAKPTGSGPNKTLTDDEKENLKETYNLTLNNSGYCVLGKLTNVLLPVAAEQEPDTEYYSTYASVINAAFDADDKFERHPSATYDSDLIDVLVWNHLGVASGAEGYAEAPSSAGLCWHLDGDLDVNAKYDLTFHANGGYFGSESTNTTNKITGLLADTYELNNTVLTNYAEPTHDSVGGVEVLFVGWTTEEPTGTDVERIYQAGDTDVPATVTSVTLPTTQELWAVWGYDTDGDGTADVNELVITPADITIYTGGNGYGGVTDADGDIITDTNNSGLPEPGYHIDLPTNIQTWLGNGTTAENLATILHFEYDVEEGVAAGTRNWAMKYAGVYATDASGNPLRYVYTLEPSDDGNGKKIPVRILYKDGDTIVDDDKIEMSATAAHEEYTMTINPGELDQNEIQAKLTKGGESKTLNVFIGTGKLTIRSVVEKVDNTSVIEADESSVTGDEIVAVGNNASYVVNDSEVSIDVTNNKDRVQLLVDKVSGNEEFDRDMENASLTHAGMSDGACETAYLDLVDTENGNTVVTLSRGSMDIYWPMPENADAEGTFRVVHYVGMDRESTVDTGDLPTLDSVQVLQGDEQVSVVTTGGQQYIKFSTDSFSPFALVYETKDDPGTDPGTDPDDNKDDDDHYTGGGGNDNDSDPTGNLSIAVDVNGDGSFTFTVILTDKDGDDLENNFYFNGDFTGTIGSGDGITLENGEEIIIRNLPEGTRYEIIVEDADGFHLIADGDTGIIHTGMNEAEFTGNPVVQLADPSVTGVSRWLNVTDHIAYLTGYPSGGFGPDNSMTRAEVAQMFYALLQNKDVPITRTFPDVPADAWYATAVNTLASLGMVSGDETGNYRPNDPITRAEFCVIALAFAYEPENTLCWFTDVNTGDWFYSYVAQAASYGWIGGYTDGTFGPNNPITRAQVTTIVNNMLGRAADRDYVLDHQEDLVQFNDLTRGHWAFFQIMEATNTHDYTIRRGEENWR